MGAGRLIGRHQVGDIADDENLAPAKRPKMVSGAARESQQAMTMTSGFCPVLGQRAVAVMLPGV